MVKLNHKDGWETIYSRTNKQGERKLGRMLMKYGCGLEGYVCSSENNEGKYQGIFMQLHPSPSGNERHILRFSTNKFYRTSNEAVLSMEKELNKVKEN